MSTKPGVQIIPSTERMSVLGETMRPGVMFMVSGLPALPMPTISPSSTPMSPFTTPSTGSMITALVTTMSSPPSLCFHLDAWPMPSRMVLPPPKTSSSP